MKSLQQLISEKESELQNLEDSLGLGFPIVEQAKMTQISHLRLELEDLRQIEKSIQLNENQQIVLKHLKSMCPPKLGLSAMVTVYCLVDDNINDNWQEYSEEIPEHIEALQKLSVAEEFQVLTAFAQWGLEQEEQWWI